MTTHNEKHIMIERLSKAFTEIPFNSMLGLRLDQIDAQQVTMSFNMKEQLIGNFLHGILHGGVTSSVLDMAGGMAVMADAIGKHPDCSADALVSIIGKCSTVDLQISFLSPGRGDVFIAKAWLIKSGRKISFTRMELSNQDGTLIAAGNGTYLIK